MSEIDESIAHGAAKLKGRRPTRVRRSAVRVVFLGLAALCVLSACPASYGPDRFAAAVLTAGALQPAPADGSTEFAEVLAKMAAVSHRRAPGLAAISNRRADQQADPGYWERTSLPLTGLATFYADGLMDYVRDYRLGQGQVGACPECVGAVALLRAGDIGRKVWLQAPGDEPVGPFLVVDCARREDYPLLLARGWAVDVSYELGQIWGMNAPLGGVTVLEDPADASAGPLRPVHALAPLVAPAGQVVITAPTATPSEVLPTPTSWPTRLPVARAGVTPTVAAPPPAPRPLWPPPLTPIITTPTPVVTPGAAAAPPPSPAGDAEPQPTATLPVEVALGRAGAGVLGQPTVTAPPLLRLPTATPAPPVRTPRPGLTPILPDALEAAPTATPSAPSLLEQIWRALLEIVQP